MNAPAERPGLVQLRRKDTVPALAWAQRHRQQLAAADERTAGQCLEFQLHQLAFLQCMTAQGKPWLGSRLRCNRTHAQRCSKDAIPAGSTGILGREMSRC